MCASYLSRVIDHTCNTHTTHTKGRQDDKTASNSWIPVSKVDKQNLKEPTKEATSGPGANTRDTR